MFCNRWVPLLVVALLFAGAAALDGQAQNQLLPVRVQLPEPLSRNDATIPVSFRTNPEAGQTLLQTSERFADEVFVMMPPEARREVTVLSLLPPQQLEGQETPAFTFEQRRSDGRLWLMDEEGPVLAYNMEEQLPEGVPEDRKRACYIHPIYGLDGEVLTDDFPDDHYHHRGLFFAWPEVFYEGERYDIWHLDDIRPRFDAVLYQETGPVCALFGIRNSWVINGETPIIEETVHVTVWQDDDKGRAIDVRLELRALEQPVTLGGEVNKGYGGFNLRYGPRPESFITTPDGLREEDSLHARFAWADLSAQFEGRDQRSGMTVIPHPSNLDYPPEYILRHYGFVGSNWPAMRSHTLHPEDPPVVMQHRVWVHRHGAEDGGVEQAAQHYIEPPCVALSPR